MSALIALPEHAVANPTTALANQLHQQRESEVIEVIDDEDEDMFNAFSPIRKLVIVAVVSLAGFNAAMDTMAVSAVVPEIAAEFNTTGSVINISNAVYVLLMAVSPLFWGPLSQVFGRRWVGLTPQTAGISTCASISLSALERCEAMV